MPRPLTIIAFLALFALLCSLGVWQLGRAAEKRTRFEAFSERYAAAPLDLDLLSGLADAPDLRWRRVSAQGEYAEPRILLDNRIRGGTAGYEVLVPFRSAGGHALLVNRGWIPAGPDRASPPAPAVPGGPVALSGFLGPPPVVGIELAQARSAVERLADDVLRVQHPDVTTISGVVGREFAALVLYLDTDAPGALATDWPTPGDGSARHRAYAVQWFAMAAVLALIGFVQLGRRRRGAPAGAP